MIVPPIEPDSDRNERDLNRNLRREDCAGRDVSTHLIGAEPMSP